MGAESSQRKTRPQTVSCCRSQWMQPPSSSSERPRGVVVGGGGTCSKGRATLSFGAGLWRHVCSDVISQEEESCLPECQGGNHSFAFVFSSGFSQKDDAGLFPMSRYSFTWTETLSPEAPAHGPTCYTRAQVRQVCAPHEAGTEPTRGAGFHKCLLRYLAGLFIIIINDN